MRSKNCKQTYQLYVYFIKYFTYENKYWKLLGTYENKYISGRGSMSKFGQSINGMISNTGKYIQHDILTVSCF